MVGSDKQTACMIFQYFLFQAVSPILSRSGGIGPTAKVDLLHRTKTFG